MTKHRHNYYNIFSYGFPLVFLWFFIVNGRNSPTPSPPSPAPHPGPLNPGARDTSARDPDARDPADLTLAASGIIWHTNRYRRKL